MRAGSCSFAGSSAKAFSESASHSDVAPRTLCGVRVARQLRELAELFGELHLTRPRRAREGDAPAPVRPVDADECEIVEGGQAVFGPDPPLRGLDGEGPARASAVVRQRDLSGEILVDEAGNIVTADVDAVRQTDDVPGEAISADVRALPYVLLLELLVQRVEEGASVARAASVVLSVCASEEERLGHPSRRSPGVDLTEVLVVGDLQLGELLLALARVGNVDPEPMVVPTVGTTDEEQTAARLRRPQLSQPRLDLVG